MELTVMGQYYRKVFLITLMDRTYYNLAAHNTGGFVFYFPGGIFTLSSIMYLYK